MSDISEEIENDFMIPIGNLPETNQEKNILMTKKDYMPYTKIVRCLKYKTSNYLDLENL